MLNDCFTQTSCLSNPETSLIRDFLATYYNLAMGVVQLTARLGNLSNFMDTIGKEDAYEDVKRQQSNTRLIEEDMRDMIIEDYKVNS